MAKILSFGRKSGSEKNTEKGNPLKSVWGSFQSLDRYGKFFIVTALLILVATPFIASNLLEVRQRAETTNKIALDMYPDHYQLFTNPQDWIQKLNDSYMAYSDLTGYTPHNGETIVYKEFPSSEMGGALMYAGNPIHWSDAFVPEMITRINNNDLSFGPVHELSHDFDVTPYSYYYIGSGDTPINAEHWANFKLTYVADTLAPKYPNSTFYQGSVGDIPIGQFSKKYFEDIFAQEWLSSSKSDWKSMKGDAYTGLLYSLTRQYGWNIFKLTFHDYLTLTDPVPIDDLQKINLFVKLLSKNAEVDLKPTFISWGIPVSDYTPAPNPGPEGFIFCGYEWDTCKFNGTAEVAFGANGKFNYGTYTNSVLCTWGTFGDPISGVTKSCYYKYPITTIIPTPTPLSSPTVIPITQPAGNDSQSPTVSITAPVNGANVARNFTITLQAGATDNVAVAHVDFLVNGSLICSDTTSPYSCNWKTLGKPNKNYTISAKAYDTSGNTAISAVNVKTSK